MFSCPICGALRSFQAVKAERTLAHRLREQEAGVDKVVPIVEPPGSDTARVIRRGQEAGRLIFD